MAVDSSLQRPQSSTDIFKEEFLDSSGLEESRAVVTTCQASYHSVSSSPSARRPSSAFDGVNEEANVRANAAVVPGYADVRAL